MGWNWRYLWRKGCFGYDGHAFRYDDLFLILSIEDRYTTSEVVDMNIIFVTSIVLVLLMAVTVYVVAAIDYGEDTAGLYSKYKQIKSQ